MLVKDGERSLCANLAAANKFTADHLASVKAKEMIAEAKMFYIASFFLTVSVESLLVVADHAVEHNKVRGGCRCRTLWGWEHGRCIDRKSCVVRLEARRVFSLAV